MERLEIFSSTHDLLSCGSVFYRPFATWFLRGPGFSGSHSTASAFLCHFIINSFLFSCSFLKWFRATGPERTPALEVSFAGLSLARSTDSARVAVENFLAKCILARIKTRRINPAQLRRPGAWFFWRNPPACAMKPQFQILFSYSSNPLFYRRWTADSHRHRLPLARSGSFLREWRAGSGVFEND